MLAAGGRLVVGTSRWGGPVQGRVRVNRDGLVVKWDKSHWFSIELARL